MKSSISIILLSLILLSFGCKKNTKDHQNKEAWIALFNGKDLNDWQIKIKGHPLNENDKNTFIVDDGVIKVSYKAYDTFSNAFGHLFYKNPFSSYKFRVDYRFTGKQVEGGADWAERNSGVMVHAQSPESMGLDQAFPVSIEVQMLGGITEGVSRPTGNLCTPGTHVVMNDTLVTEHCINADAETFYGNQWVNLEVMVIKDSLITHRVNGKEVMRYTKPQIGGNDLSNYGNSWKDKIGTPLTKGYIALQSESHPIEFKNIELLELK